MHAGRMWCHCRMVYLPMSYLYGRRYVGPINGIVLSLRSELYTQPYHQIHWDQARNLCAKVWFFFLRKKIYGKYGICQKFKNNLYYSITFLLQLWCNGLWIIVYHLSMNLLFFLTSYTLSHHNCDKKSYIIVFNIRGSFGTCV